MLRFSARRIGTWVLRGLLLLVILIEALYLARRPLFEGRVIALAQDALHDALSADVRVAAVRGNWITEVECDVEIAGGRGLVRLEGATVHARIAPWEGLLPSALRQVELRARAAEIDLDGFARGAAGAETEAGPAAPASPPDLSPFAAAARDGLHVAIDRLTLRRGDARIDGEVTVTAPARAASAPLAVEVHAPQLAVSATLDARGDIRGDVRAGDTGLWLALIAGLDEVTGGRTRARVALQLAPSLSLDAHAEVQDGMVRKREVRAVSADATIIGSALHVAHLDVRAEGVHVDGADIACDLGRPDARGLLASLRGSLRVAIDDPAPLRSILPPDVAALAPRVTAEASLSGSRLDVASLLVTTPEGDTVRASGALDLAAPDAKRLVRDAALDVDIERLDFGRWLRALHVTGIGGVAHGSVRWQPARSVPLAVDLAGDVQLGAGQAVQSRIALRSDAARGTVLEALELSCGDARLRADGRAPTLTVPLLLEHPLAALLEEVAVQARLDAPDLAAVDLAAVGGPALSGGIAGQLSATGPIAGLALQADLDLTRVTCDPAFADVRDLSGHVSLTPQRLELIGVTATLYGRTLVVAGVVDRGDDATRVESLDITDSDLGRVIARGTLGTPTPAAWLDALATRCDLALDLRELHAGSALALLGVSGIDGTLAGDLRWHAQGAPELEVRLAGPLTGLRPDPSEGSDFALEVHGDAQGIALTRVHADCGAGSVSGDARIDGVTPADLLRDPAKLASAPLHGEVAFTGVDLSGWSAASLGLGDLSGRVDGSLTVSGSIADPTPLLALGITDGALRLRGGPRFADVTARLRVTRTDVVVDEMRTAMGAAPVTISGSFRAPGQLLDTWRDGELDLHIVGEGALLYRHEGLRLRGDVDVMAKGKPSAITARGTVALRSSKLVSRIPYVTFGKTGGAAASGKGIVFEGPDLGPDFHVTLGIDVTTAEPVQIASNIMTGDVAASMRISGPLESPVLVGTLSGAGASLSLPGCHLVAQTLLVNFSREDPHFPTVNIVASGRRHGYDIQVVVRGRYDEPEVLFSSNPPLPADQLAVLVVTGATPETLRQQGVRGVGTVLGSYLARELGDYLFGTESTEAKESFISRFEVDSGAEISANGTESIVLEFRVVDRFYLQGERDVYEDMNFGVVYRVKFK